MGEQDSASPEHKSASPAPAVSPAVLLDADAAIEAATSPSEEDDLDPSDGYETATTGSTSATSSVYAHTFEHGRRYQHFKNSRYPIPNDDIEQNREDMKHAMLLEVTDGRLFYAPVGEHPQMILDIGTGTGIWAIDAGDKYPSARVRGIDLSPIQPVYVPPNVDFLVDDCNEEWLDRNCDLIHLRFVTAMLKDTASVMSNAFKSLRSGGWLEVQEFDAVPLCDDGTMPDDDPVKRLYDLMEQAFGKFGMDVALPGKLESFIRDAGFVNIQCVVKKVPIGVWARDKTLRLVGLYQKLAVLDLMPAVAGRPFTALGLSYAEKEVTLGLARKGLDDPGAHRYFNYYFWFAQKPEGT